MLCGLDLDSLPFLVTQKAGITDIPVRLLTNEILLFCGVRDMLPLGCTNKFFAHIMSDDALWRRKLVIDYNFTGSETNRTSGWKFIYLRLGKPRLFSWGCVMFLFRYVTEASALAGVLACSPILSERSTNLYPRDLQG